jgi:hypothetical protein
VLRLKGDNVKLRLERGYGVTEMKERKQKKEKRGGFIGIE